MVKGAVEAVTGAIAGRALGKAPELLPVVTGTPVSRVDGLQKVTGEARYTMDVALPSMAHAVLVTSTIARGRITQIDAAEAAALPGVITIFTHENAPRLRKNLVPQIGAGRWSIGRDFRPLQDDRVRFAGQPVAMVLAETYEQANDAATRMRVSYEAEEAETDLRAALPEALPPALRLGKADYARGDAAAAFAAAPVRVEGEYSTPPQTNNPLGLFATVAAWDGDHLTLYDANQWTRNVRSSASSVLGRPSGGVEVSSAFVGGGFGAGLRAWPHAWLAAVAAREIGRPVQIVLTRAQMFTAVGRRAETVSKVSLGAERDGRLTAIIHDAVHDTSRDEDFVEALTTATRMLYACDNVATRYRTTRLDRSTPTYMRCPGEAETLFALECALDELAYALDIDPIALRLRNEPDRDLEKDEPWSSRSLAACYERGAELFGWSRRTPEPGSMRDDDILIGYGVASATYPAFAMPASAVACLFADGTALVRAPPPR
jgi:xanthine dehydrogenase YagR molybdenum-binding subunit